MSVPKIGILAVVHLDGSISVYAVPHPLAIRRLQGDKGKASDKPIFCEFWLFWVKGLRADCLQVNCLEPLLRVEVFDAAATCMDWFTGSKLAVGYSNGMFLTLLGCRISVFCLASGDKVDVPDARAGG